MKRRVIIMGAAGRDFHNYNMLYRDDPAFEVVAFTAAQIPFIEKRRYPAALSGALYPDGIPIFAEEGLAGLIEELKADEVVFSYSDVSHGYVMHRASLVTALGADFVLLGAEKTMLRSTKPVISVSAVRTGCGKSGVTRFIAGHIADKGRKAVVMRHPMPYGDLAAQRVQRFTSLDEMKAANCTIEEMEEYEPLVTAGIPVYAGVDYGDVLKEAEKEADVIVWDGGNNDLPFIRPDLEICVVDPLRPGHEVNYHPGEACLRRASVVIINKANSALPEDLAKVMENVKQVNPSAEIINTASIISFKDSSLGKGMTLRRKKVLVVEDGPTLTHGGMAYGAGWIAAKTMKAVPIDPGPFAIGSIKDALERFTHLKNVLPALGYSTGQIKELEETINSAPCDAVIVATPVDLAKLIHIAKPVVRVAYEVRDIEKPGLTGIVNDFLAGLK